MIIHLFCSVPVASNLATLTTTSTQRIVSDNISIDAWKQALAKGIDDYGSLEDSQCH